jgi:hypothetical protein
MLAHKTRKNYNDDDDSSSSNNNNNLVYNLNVITHYYRLLSQSSACCHGLKAAGVYRLCFQIKVIELLISVNGSGVGYSITQ